MDNLVKSGENGLLGLFHRQNGDLLIPKPFERDIFFI